MTEIVVGIRVIRRDGNRGLISAKRLVVQVPLIEHNAEIVPRLRVSRPKLHRSRVRGGRLFEHSLLRQRQAEVVMSLGKLFNFEGSTVRRNREIELTYRAIRFAEIVVE